MWARDSETDQTIDDLVAFGAPQELIGQARKIEDKAQVFEVWPENIEAVRMFVRLRTQWVAGVMGGISGLNYLSVESLFRIYKVKDRRQMFEDIQVMEDALLDLFRNEQEKDAR